MHDTCTLWSLVLSGTPSQTGCSKDAGCARQLHCAPMRAPRLLCAACRPRVFQVLEARGGDGRGADARVRALPRQLVQRGAGARGGHQDAGASARIARASERVRARAVVVWLCALLLFGRARGCLFGRSCRVFVSPRRAPGAWEPIGRG
eukprot:3110862-Pleurochrysis_carterae.AAC.1